MAGHIPYLISNISKYFSSPFSVGLSPILATIDHLIILDHIA